MAGVKPSDPVIRFPCKCGHRFEVPIDQAGGTIQCSRCGLLADIPLLSDLEHIASDGTMMMQPAAPRVEPNRLGTLTRAFGPDHADSTGQEKDLRPTYDDIVRAGVEPIPYDEKETFGQVAPKYDPETGELVQPIAVAPGAPVGAEREAIPVASRALSYAAGEHAKVMSLPRVMLEMCQPVNMVVMLLIMGLHVLMQFMFVATLYRFFLVTPFMLGTALMILAHFANTVDETGPSQCDELPRPFRDFSFNDDLWNPLWQLLNSLLFCYGPALLVQSQAPEGLARQVISVALLAAGTLFFPAMLLTLSTSGTMLNARPDRVWGVIRATGWRYVIALVTWVIAAPLYVVAVFALLGQMLPSSYLLFGIPLLQLRGAYLYPLLFLGIFLVQFFGWQLGLLYRGGYEAFPWVMQRYVSQRAQEEREQVRAAKARAKVGRTRAG